MEFDFEVPGFLNKLGYKEHVGKPFRASGTTFALGSRRRSPRLGSLELLMKVPGCITMT